MQSFPILQTLERILEADGWRKTNNSFQLYEYWKEMMWR